MRIRHLLIANVTVKSLVCSGEFIADTLTANVVTESNLLAVKLTDARG